MCYSADRLRWFTRICFGLAMVASSIVLAQTGVNPSREDLGEARKIYSPYIARTARNSNFAEGVFWGDTHLHTS